MQALWEPEGIHTFKSLQQVESRSVTQILKKPGVSQAFPPLIPRDAKSTWLPLVRHV